MTNPPRSSNLDILAYEPTPLGDLCLRRRELLSQPGTVITEITLDHQLLMSSHNTVSERALATEALERDERGDLFSLDLVKLEASLRWASVTSSRKPSHSAWSVPWRVTQAAVQRLP